MKKMYLEQNAVILFFLSNSPRKSSLAEDVFYRYINNVTVARV
jgi:hypothetical protein